MPIVPGASAAELGPVARLPEQPAPGEGPSALDVAAAAERTANLGGTLFDRLTAPRPDAHAEPGFDPVTSIPEGYEAFGDRFLDANSPEQIAWTKQRIDSELRDRAVLARAGKSGFAAVLAAGLTDPLTLASMLIPVGGETRLAQAGRLALINAGTTAAQEAAMHELTVTRDARESVFNVAGSAVLGGILGAAIRPHVPHPLAEEVGDRLTQELHDPNAGDEVLGPARASVLDAPLPSDLEARAAAPLEQKFRAELTADHEGAKARYEALSNPKIADTQGGRILNVDMARELSPEYVADRTGSAEVHEPASEFVKELYAEKLAEAPKEGQAPFVLFTAGGTGAGKTTAIERVPALKDLADHAQIIYDTNMSSLESSVQKVDQALAAGKDVQIAYVYRDPVEALTEGALPRAMRMGRTVPIEEHAKTHAGSFDVIRQLQQRYAGNPRVSFAAVDNSLGRGNARLSSMVELQGKRYNVGAEELRNAVEQEFKAGRISEAVRSGTNARAAGPGGQAAPGAPAGVRGQPEPQRQAQAPVEPGASAPSINPTGESTAGAAAVARPGMDLERVARGARTLAGGPIGRAAPGLRVLSSRSLEARRLVQELANTPEFLEKNYAWIATAQPVERKLWGYDGVWYQAWKARGDLFREYRARMAGLERPAASRSEFNQAVAQAMRRGDKSDVPEVAKAAAQTRAIVFEPLKQRAMKLGLLPEDVKATGADSYLTRQYDVAKIRADMGRWQATLAEGFRAQGVDTAEALDLAHRVTRTILGSERGTMDWRTMEGIVPQSGRLKERTLTLPDQLLEPFLNSDIDHLSHSYLRSMAPEVEFTERFGSRDMKDRLDAIRDEYAVLMEQAKARGEDAAPLHQEMASVVHDLEGMRDRLYGIAGRPKDPGAFYVAAERAMANLRSVNALRLLGAATLAHFPDVANVIMRYGMPRTFSAIARVLSSSEALHLAADEAKRMGAALDMVMNLTASILGDYGSHSQFAEQRALAKTTRAFTIATGETPLITFIQALTSSLASDGLLRTAERVAAGRALSRNEVAKLAASGIDQAMLERIGKAAADHMQEVNGLRFGMSDKWTDRAAAQAFESAVLRDAHSVTLRPGVGDTPLWMSTGLGRTILQFKSFAFASSRIVVNPLLQGLAHGDLNAVQGLFALAFMGAVSYVAKQKAAGQPVELDHPGRLAMEVLDKSNLLGWTGEFVFPALWQLGMRDLSRWSDRDAMETLLGPSAGTIGSLYERRLPSKLTADTEAGEKGFSRSDLHFLRRLMPGQNHWVFRRAVNWLEDAVGDTFDLPGKSNAERAEETAAAR